MKKLTIALIIAALAFSFAACTSEDSNSASTQNTPETVNENGDIMEDMTTQEPVAELPGDENTEEDPEPTPVVEAP